MLLLLPHLSPNRSSNSRDRTFSDSEEETDERERERVQPSTAAPVPLMAASGGAGGWDDPTEVNWDNEEEDKDELIVPEPKEAIFKCSALYSYTVSKQFNGIYVELMESMLRCRHKIPMN